MTVHSFSGVTAKITVSSSLVGFVSGDFSLAVATGRYTELNKNTSTSLTRGLRTVSGTLKKAWGIGDNTLYSYFNTNQMFDITFDNDGDGAGGATGANTYTLSGCMLTDLAVEGVEAGAEAALMINASFEGLDWSRDA
tara:strand:+ start:672 stop:1085 length:414 start_codon:yes stop_codon:yes gene_type:complete